MAPKFVTTVLIALGIAGFIGAQNHQGRALMACEDQQDCNGYECCAQRSLRSASFYCFPKRGEGEACTENGQTSNLLNGIYNFCPCKPGFECKPESNGRTSAANGESRCRRTTASDSGQLLLGKR